ncbi:MAG: hypothetical protein U1E91_03325 [Moraxella sp.]
MDVSKQQDIDNKLLALDGTENKEKLSANATLAVSLAGARAAAQSQNPPLHQALLLTYVRANITIDAGADDEHPKWRCPRGQHR